MQDSQWKERRALLAAAIASTSRRIEEVRARAADTLCEHRALLALVPEGVDPSRLGEGLRLLRDEVKWGAAGGGTVAIRGRVGVYEVATFGQAAHVLVRCNPSLRRPPSAVGSQTAEVHDGYA